LNYDFRGAIAQNFPQVHEYVNVHCRAILEIRPLVVGYGVRLKLIE